MHQRITQDRKDRATPGMNADAERPTNQARKVRQEIVRRIAARHGTELTA